MEKMSIMEIVGVKKDDHVTHKVEILRVKIMSEKKNDAEKSRMDRQMVKFEEYAVCEKYGKEMFLQKTEARKVRKKDETKVLGTWWQSILTLMTLVVMVIIGV